MILTLTLNPAIDQTITVDRLVLGEVNRFDETRLDPAGKGINVSRMVDRLGWPTLAFGFAGGEIGELLEQSLDGEHVPTYFVPTDGQTRVNVTVVDEATGTSTNFYGPGPAIGHQALFDLEGLLGFWLQAARVLVLAGSLPDGVPDDIYAQHIRLAGEKGVRTILDADGEPFRLGLEARPSLIKPNRDEAEALLGRELPDVAAAVEGARELAARGIETVVISMGGDGAVCVSGDRAWRAMPPPVERRSTVGSGDSMVAGLAVALARGDDIVEGLRLGTAAGAATASSTGTALGTAEEVWELLPLVRIEELE